MCLQYWIVSKSINQPRKSTIEYTHTHSSCLCLSGITLRPTRKPNAGKAWMAGCVMKNSMASSIQTGIGLIVPMTRYDFWELHQSCTMSLSYEWINQVEFTLVNEIWRVDQKTDRVDMLGNCSHDYALEWEKGKMCSCQRIHCESLPYCTIAQGIFPSHALNGLSCSMNNLPLLLRAFFLPKTWEKNTFLRDLRRIHKW